MEYDIFKAGVAPGSPTTQNEIKMLVCYILSQIDAPMSFEQLHQSMVENSLVNYFDLVAVLDGLTATGHLEAKAGEQEGEIYSLTDDGRKVAEELTTSLPLAVREKAVAAAQRLLSQRHRLSEVSFSAEAQPGGGYLLHFSIPSDAPEERPANQEEPQLISFSVFAPSQAERDLIRRRFLNDPLFLYKGVMSLLTGSREVLGELLPGKDELF